MPNTNVFSLIGPDVYCKENQIPSHLCVETIEEIEWLRPFPIQLAMSNLHTIFSIHCELSSSFILRVKVCRQYRKYALTHEEILLTLNLTWTNIIFCHLTKMTNTTLICTVFVISVFNHSLHSVTSSNLHFP